MALGFALGFEWGDVDRVLKTNRMDGEMTWKGTLRMLQNWKQNTTKEFQREKLRSALTRSGLAEVADQHFPEGLYTYTPGHTHTHTHTHTQRLMIERFFRAQSLLIIRSLDRRRSIVVMFFLYDTFNIT